MSEKAKLVTISNYWINEFNSQCNHLFEEGYSMIHYSVAGLPQVHEYGEDKFHVLYTAVFELKNSIMERIGLRKVHDVDYSR